jgi:hypothetical protein
MPHFADFHPILEREPAGAAHHGFEPAVKTRCHNVWHRLLLEIPHQPTVIEATTSISIVKVIIVPGKLVNIVAKPSPA